MTAINFNNDEHDNKSDANDSFSWIGSKLTCKEAWSFDVDKYNDQGLGEY